MPIERLPARLQHPARRVRAWLMTDSTATLIAGTGVLLRGLSYVPVVLGDPPRNGGHPAELILPIQLWGWIWVLVGVACLIAAVVHHPKLESWLLGTAVGLHVMWGTSFLTSTITGESDRAWVSSISYFMVAALVMWAIWRGKRGDLPEREAYEGVGGA